MPYEQYERDGKTVWVRSDLKGRQTEFCMCVKCARFTPEKGDRCALGQAVLTFMAQHNLDLPVWECGSFVEKAFK